MTGTDVRPSEDGTLTPRPRRRPPAASSPEVTEEGRVSLRLVAPTAGSVVLICSDIPGAPISPERWPMERSENGTWAITIDSVPPGSYCYLFDVDGVRTVDPQNPVTSESTRKAWSLVRVPGAAFLEPAEVPHGAVSLITYRSTSLGSNRRTHVYTPPGYETGTDNYPVLYLLHGAGDTDDTWTEVGLAHNILDNLIAAKQARDMIVVVLNCDSGWPGRRNIPRDRFEIEFEEDLRPHIEQRFRVKADCTNRAIAGLSMGGVQVLNLFASSPDLFSAVGVFSTGVLTRLEEWEAHYGPTLSGSKNGPKLLWIPIGTEDPLLQQTKATVALLKSYGLKPELELTDGGHNWINWRKYLHRFAQKLFF